MVTAATAAAMASFPQGVSIDVEEDADADDENSEENAQHNAHCPVRVVVVRRDGDLSALKSFRRNSCEMLHQCCPRARAW